MKVKHIAIPCVTILIIAILFYLANVYTTYEVLLSEYQNHIKSASTIKDKEICYDVELMIHAADEMRQLCKHQREWGGVKPKRRALFDAMQQARKTTFDISGLIDLIKTVSVTFFGLGFLIAVMSSSIYFMWMRKCPPCENVKLK